MTDPRDAIEHTDACCDSDSAVCICDFDGRMRAASRAKDFEKCTDPHCPDLGKHFGGGALPHCHPVF